MKSVKLQDYYLPVYTATDEIELINDEDKSDKIIQVVGETVNKVNKASVESIKNYKLKPVEKTDASNGNGLAIALIAIVATIVIIWIFFKDKIMEMLGGNESFVSGYNPDGTKIIRG
ncbi:hypothetical protein [Acidiplasma sp.]|uniref:hypothetical protein n=1 Tax=Acidiplasma sp. TaxID=1872114 RepID=UPI00258CE8C9|nr:hypothetical protein [Acidiplasma sp.]